LPPRRLSCCRIWSCVGSASARDSLAETRRFSADVYAYFTADPNLRVWGSIAQAWPRSEGVLFPGLTIVILAAIGVRAKLAPSRHASCSDP